MLGMSLPHDSVDAKLLRFIDSMCKRYDFHLDAPKRQIIYHFNDRTVTGVVNLLCLENGFDPDPEDIRFRYMHKTLHDLIGGEEIVYLAEQRERDRAAGEEDAE